MFNCFTWLWLTSGLHKLWQPCSVSARKWRENEEMERKWTDYEEMERKWTDNEEMEMERDSLSTFPHSVCISPLSIHFLYQNLSHFVAKC